ncbi:MAG TPA: hypothetical protein VKR80_02570, partial [Candidatus Limnocylindria bacterium]|nr:hypothetical protein [Candidatus Limnocylindria bacterium]
MSADARKLVRFVCTAKAHAGARSDAALTIHDGAWAFCAAGSDAKGHQWEPSDGLPITEAMRFTPRDAASRPPGASAP